MLYRSRILRTWQQQHSKESASVPLSTNTLKDVILKGIGKPTSSDEIRYFKRNNKLKPVAPCFGGEIRPKLKLIATAIGHNDLPPAELPEVAFYGRTNAGKSCLINAICGRYGVCPVHELPGTTRKLHFYKVGTPSTVIFVDMPGYGYSTAKDDLSMQWNEFSLSYLKHRNTLKLLVVLVDCRIGLKQSDLEVINFCDKYKVRWQVVLAKADMVKPVLVAKMLHKVRLELAIFRSSNGKPIAISSTKNQNLEEIRGILEHFNVDKPTAHLLLQSRKRDNISNKNLLNDTIKGGITKSNYNESSNPPTLILSKTDESEICEKGYDLWKYITVSKDSYDRNTVALKCLADIYSRFTPLPDFIDKKRIAALPTVTYTENAIDRVRHEVQSFTESEGNLACDVHITLADTLISCEETKPLEEKLINDKIVSYQRHLMKTLKPIAKITKPDVGRSYKRVLSLFKSSISSQKIKWNATDRDKLTWSAAYQKWERWSKRHPQLSRSMDPPTKLSVTEEGRKTHIRSQQLKVYNRREALRKGRPKIKNRKSL